jgi:hypothetical protein
MTRNSLLPMAVAVALLSCGQGYTPSSGPQSNSRGVFQLQTPPTGINFFCSQGQEFYVDRFEVELQGFNNLQDAKFVALALDENQSPPPLTTAPSVQFCGCTDLTGGCNTTPQFTTPGLTWLSPSVSLPNGTYLLRITPIGTFRLVNTGGGQQPDTSVPMGPIADTFEIICGVGDEKLPDGQAIVPCQFPVDEFRVLGNPSLTFTLLTPL